MDKKLAEHVADLHQRAFTIDAHFDLTYEVGNLRDRGEKKVVEGKFLDPLKAGGFDLVVSAIFIHDFFLPEMGLRKALDQISHLMAETRETPGKFSICKNLAEVNAAKADGRLAIFLSLEGAEPLQNDLNLLPVFYELGVRALGLVWSRRNYVGDGCFFTDVKEGRKGGLTAFGVRVVEMAQDLGMLIDLSHMNDEGFWDVLSLTEKPVVASHSNCRALAPSMRNLTDDQIKALGKNGGVMGLNAMNIFVTENGIDATVAHLADHVDRIANLAGIEHVGVGFDLCDTFPNHLNVEVVPEIHGVITSHAQLGEFTAALIERGYTDHQILMVLGGNFLRVWEKVFG